MPKRVDHEERRHQITDAVCRITAKGGLVSATFREVAAEAGVSVRLVQYYFGTKDQLLLVTQQHVAQRATKRILARVAKVPDTPGAVLRAILTSFVPDDDESRENMFMFVALYTTSLVDPTLARDETRRVPEALQATVERQLRRAKLRKGVDPKREAQILVSVVPSQAQAVLDGSQTARGAIRVIHYAIDRALL
jgi:TetR/AcrR family transcriptional regulator, transcriptional repressor of bet genes